MQKTLEILKKGDGITIKKLSHRKILVEYSIPIYYDYNDESPFEYIYLKVRYSVGELDKNPMDFFSNEKIKGFIIRYPKVGFWQLLSNKLRLKMKNIQSKFIERMTITLDSPFDDVYGREILIDRYYSKLYITDPIWVRNHKIKKLLC